METLQTIGICVGAFALVLIAFFLFLISGSITEFQMSTQALADIMEDERPEEKEMDTGDREKLSVWKTEIKPKSPGKKPK
jgi:hypothetical protein